MELMVSRLSAQRMEELERIVEEDRLEILKLEEQTEQLSSDNISEERLQVNKSHIFRTPMHTLLDSNMLFNCERHSSSASCSAFHGICCQLACYCALWIPHLLCTFKGK